MSKVLALGLLLALAAPAMAGGELDGTWAGGWTDGHGVQIVVLNDSLIAFYRDGQDYVDTSREVMTPGGGALSFAWNKGEAVLIRDKNGTRLMLHDNGKPVVTVPLTRD